MSTVTDWLEVQLRNHLPEDGLEGGEYGRRVQALAQARAALDGRQSTIFGMLFGGDARAEAEYLQEPFTNGLRDWRSFMEQRLGDKGREFVESIAFEFDVQLGPLLTLRCDPLGTDGALDKRAKDVLSSLLSKASNRKGLTEAWRGYGQLQEVTDCVAIWAGLPSEKELRRMAEVYEHHFEVAFPPELGFLLSHLNGVAISSESNSDDCDGVMMVSANELSEPSLWSSSYDDQLIFEGLNLAPKLTFYVIGEIPDSGYLALGALRKRDVPEVYWLDQELSAREPHLLANSLTDFFEAWAKSALCLPEVLKAAHTPGWAT